MKPLEYRSVYTVPGSYDELLLPHYFDGVEDTELFAAELRRLCGPTSHKDLRVLEIGCGTGRMTATLVPYASHLLATDFSVAMTDAVKTAYPHVDARPIDALQVVEHLTNDGLEGSFDLVAVCWSLSYPIGECFETVTSDGIEPVADLDLAYQRAHGFIRDLLRLLAPGGRLVALLFDAGTAEQQLVTDLWDRLAPHPAGGRDLSRRVLEHGLRAAENAGKGHMTWRRHAGVAVASNPDVARRWFLEVHLKSHPTLLADPQTRADVEEFIANFRHGDGRVLVPSGVHLVTFVKSTGPACHLPAGGPR